MEQFTQKVKSSHLPSTRRWKVRWSLAALETFLELHSKTALQHSPKQPKELDTCRFVKWGGKKLNWLNACRSTEMLGHVSPSSCLCPQIDRLTGMVMNLTDLKKCIEVRSSQLPCLLLTGISWSFCKIWGQWWIVTKCSQALSSCVCIS